MALRKIHEETKGRVTVKVFRDSEWNEYRARLYVDGKLHAPSDAHDDDKNSILGTAKQMLNYEFAKVNPRVKTVVKKSVKKSPTKAAVKNPRVKVDKNFWIVQYIKTDNDRNGNPRHAYLIWANDGSYMGFLKVGYSGKTQALFEYFGDKKYIEISGLVLTVAQYNQLKNNA